MESSAPPTPVAKKLKPILRAVSHMIKKGIISRRKLMLDLHLLLERTKIAGKAITNILTFNNNHHNPAAFFYSPHEVEFSCSNTPSYPPPHVHKRKNHSNIEGASAASTARAFEMMSEEINYSVAESVVPSPSLRVTDSVFPIKEEEEVITMVELTDKLRTSSGGFMNSCVFSNGCNNRSANIKNMSWM